MAFWISGRTSAYDTATPRRDTPGIATVGTRDSDEWTVTLGPKTVGGVIAPGRASSGQNSFHLLRFVPQSLEKDAAQVSLPKVGHHDYD